METRSLENRFIGNYENHPVFLVDGEAARNTSIALEDFSDFMLSVQDPTDIPLGHLWINSELDHEEQGIALASGLAMLRALDDGKSIDEAADIGEKRDAELRDGTEEDPSKSKPNTKALEECLYDPWGPINNGKTLVWLVYGNKTRKNFGETWICGGNSQRYKWIPPWMLIVESTVPPDEIPVIILHEWTEFVGMEGGLTYDAAHRTASRLEFANRGHFTAGDARALTTDKAMGMILALGIEKAKKELQ